MVTINFPNYELGKAMVDSRCQLIGQKCGINGIYKKLREEKRERVYPNGVKYTTVCILKCICDDEMFEVKSGYCVKKTQSMTNQQIIASTITVDPRNNMVSDIPSSDIFFIIQFGRIQLG